MHNEVYKKENGKFVKVGYEFTGFPSNGLWMVEDGKQNCLIPMGEIPKFPESNLIEFLPFKDELTSLISSKWDDKALSVSDIASIACTFFAEKAAYQKNS